MWAASRPNSCSSRSRSMRRPVTTGAPIPSRAVPTATSVSAGMAPREPWAGRWTGRCSLPERQRTARRSGPWPGRCRAGAGPRAKCCACYNSHTPPQESRMPVIAKTVVLLVLSNIFMTFAWYAHLRHLSQRPWIVAALVSWGIALFEYLLQVPANRIGHTQLQLGQLKILQEIITLSVFAPFAAFYMKEPVRLNYLWAALCMCGAVFFMFRR